jgi:hypothetical protein
MQSDFAATFGLGILTFGLWNLLRKRKNGGTSSSSSARYGRPWHSRRRMPAGEGIAMQAKQCGRGHELCVRKGLEQSVFTSFG